MLLQQVYILNILSQVMIEIIKDIIPIREQIEMHTYVRDSSFAYRFYNTHIFTEDEDPRFTHAPQQLSHQLYNCEEEKSSTHIKMLRPIFDVLKNKFVLVPINVESQLSIV